MPLSVFRLVPDGIGFDQFSNTDTDIFKINTVVIGIKFEKIKQVKNIKYGFPIDEIPLKIRTANTPSEIIIG